MIAGLLAPENAGLRRKLLTVCLMTATIMQALDTTIANVALPYMQGSFSAAYDQVTWVLTSYIVAAAIATAPIGWIAERFGRKRLFMVCAGGFTVASVLCGVAQSIEQMVLFRVLQGLCGAGLVPLSQSVMLDSYPPQQRGMAMAIWGMGVMVGPIMGPTLGGWLTQNYSWHWVFLINVPFGIVTVVGLFFIMEETKPQHSNRFDWMGFIALSVGIGSLQLMLDRGEQLDWFSSKEIITEMVVAIAGFYYFFAHSLTTQNPFINFKLFRDRNFAMACAFMVMIGLVLFSTMALITPFLQTLLGFPIVDAGVMIAARGVGTMISMMVAGRSVQFFQARNLIFIGFALNALSLYVMSGFTDQTTQFSVIWTGLVGGFGLGMIFIPLNTVAFVSLSGPLRTAGTTVLTLMRNVSSSIGISLAIATLSSTTTLMHARLAEHITPFNDALQMPNVANTINLATDQGRAMMDLILTQQATVISFENVFWGIMWIFIMGMPFLALFGSSRAAMRGGAAGPPAHAAAMD